MEKIYKIKIYPDDKQKEFIHKTFICYRMVYNHFLKRRTEAYADSRENLNLYDCSCELTLLKHSEPFSVLQDADSIALQEALIELDEDFQKFFKFPKKSLYPQFKKQSCENYYITARKNNNIYFEDEYIKLPKMSKIRMEKRINRTDEIEKVKITKESLIDNYYIFIYFYDNSEK